MEGSDNGFSSSNTPRSPLVPKSSPSGSGENNENDTSQDQMNSKLHNPKKLVAKHFMSPTKSASSKIAFSKKKILAERNENSSFSDTQIRKSPDLEMKNSPLNSSIGHSGRSSSWFIPSNNCAPGSNDNGVVADSSLKPYDPYTNYLSPRPKYLRYDPNKRRMIFHRKLSESREGKDGTEIQKGVGDGMVEEEEVEEEEEREEFEEKGWSLRGVLKFLLILFVCFLSKTYVSSMNSSALSPNLQTVSGFKDEAAYLEVYGDGFLEVEERESGLGVHNILMVKEDDNLDMGDKNTKPYESEHDSEVGKKGELDNIKMGEVYNMEKVKNSEAELAEVDNVERVETSEAAMVENDVLHMEDSKKESVEYDSDSEVVKTCEVFKEVPLAVVAKSKDIEGGEVEYIADAKITPSDDAGGNELVKEVEGSDQLKKPMTFQEEQTPQNTEGVKQPNMELIESHELPVNLVDEVDEEFYDDSETKKVGSNILVVTGVFTFSIMLASLSFFCRSKKGKTTSMLNPLTSIVEDEVARGPPVLEVEEELIEKTMTLEVPAEEEEHIRKEIIYSIRPLSLSSSIAEATKEIGSYIHAPTIELLGEFVIKEVGSSHGKIPATEYEESNASQKGLKSCPDYVPSQPFSYVSTKDSQAYGSFTDERKILKKEGGKDGESKIELTTPVRRSSRLRNRSVVSP
ncbi:uncharacterized protein LOC111405086 isoform X1 [Olea europaea var. sylvestris]|uniref:uncharacterized protein LOC111405086 isoform X1 n=2 Tax=Olea europaea var. sylvestris TaxID=158386 RepID=UPI000C1D21BE|nr:uncharacterized protein LOC111405086 isoform X1 [Olea europaea var. sylvestris]